MKDENRTTFVVKLDDDEARQLRLLKVYEDRSYQDIIAQALSEYMAKQGDK